MKKLIIIAIATVLAQITGWSILILAGINFLWLLVKDTTLFSWWVLMYTFLGFVVCVAVAIWSYVWLKMKS